MAYYLDSNFLKDEETEVAVGEWETAFIDAGLALNMEHLTFYVNSERSLDDEIQRLVQKDTYLVIIRYSCP